ncbi:MAG TPA: hypothetical protein VGO86_07165 [Candidatus Dormibacteraeota bacterium]|jgi:hypothetical protein
MTPYRPSTQQSPDDAGDLSTLVEVAGRIVDSVPAGSPLTWRKLTYRAVLAAVLRDAVENGTDGLEPDDETNLRRFVQDAAAAAGRATTEHSDDAYELVLQALLADWVDNWDSSSSDEDDDEDDDDVEDERPPT